MMINPVLRILNYVVYGGSWNLREYYEASVMATIQGQLADADAAAVAEHLKKLNHIKRLNYDKMVSFYFQSKNELARLSR